MKNLGVIFLLLFSLIKGTEARALSPEAEISLLTSAPYEAEVFFLRTDKQWEAVH